MINNIDLLKECFLHKESYIDKYYIKENKTIITEDLKNLNMLMTANSSIIDNISAYKIALECNNIEMQEVTLKNIIKALETGNINFSEFTSYRSVKDISYSIYKGLKNEDLKMDFLRNILPDFIKDRHYLYKTHGYSFSTLQVLSDSKAHKGNGNTGNKKITDILHNHGFKYYNSNNFIDFISSDKVYIYPDKNDKIIFDKIINHYNIKFERSKKHENKQTDCLFKIGDHIFIMEHKHMKESGGGQDKQMSEIIDFISYNDGNNIHYISFLDGIYCNILGDNSIISGKSHTQRINIIENLSFNKQNYFVNTYGFNKLIKSL